jgi:hypothetical protein
VLSADANLTVQTVAAVVKALGYTFDVVFRKADEAAAAQPWQQQLSLQLALDEEAGLASWMSRKTMKPMAAQFAGAQEFVRLDLTLDASNHGVLYEELANAA